MNSETGVKRGDLIKPSARKSIHSHRFCPFLASEYEIVMGRYGLNDPNRSKELGPSTSNDEGRDEVDNVMSKFAIPIDVAHKSSKHIRARRCSIDNDLSDHFNQDVNFSIVLSKSLPTTLPSHSYYSDDSSESQDEGHTSNGSGTTVRHFTSKTNSSGEDSFLHSFSERESSISPEHIRRRQSQSLEKNRTKAISSGVIYLPFIIVVLAVSVFAFTNFNTKSAVVKSFNYDKNNFYNDMMNLATKYNVNHESIEQVQMGISSIFEKEDADSFVFVYNSKSSSFDQEAFDNFMNDIAYFTARYLRNESSSVQHTVVDGASLSMRNSEELIEKYSDEVTKTGVMLVKEIDSVPSTLAMAFHYYCDEYNPIAKKSAIFSTFDIAKCSQGKTSSHAILEKCLENKWRGVPPDNMRPLLARVVSVIIDVTIGF